MLQKLDIQRAIKNAPRAVFKDFTSGNASQRNASQAARFTDGTMLKLDLTTL